MEKTKYLSPNTLKTKVKSSKKSKVQDFEDVAIEIGIEEGYDYIICGHIQAANA